MCLPQSCRQLRSSHQLGGWLTILILNLPDPFWFEFFAFFDYLHNGLYKVGRHFLWKRHTKKSKEKLVKCAIEVAHLERLNKIFFGKFQSVLSLPGCPAVTQLWFSLSGEGRTGSLGMQRRGGGGTGILKEKSFSFFVPEVFVMKSCTSGSRLQSADIWQL